jgi:hypothetical protein
MIFLLVLSLKLVNRIIDIFKHFDFLLEDYLKDHIFAL